MQDPNKYYTGQSAGPTAVWVVDGAYRPNPGIPTTTKAGAAAWNNVYWWMQFNMFGYGQGGGGGASVAPDLTNYYIKESDLYELYPYTSTSGTKQWETDRDAGKLFTKYSSLDDILKAYTNKLLPYYNASKDISESEWIYGTSWKKNFKLTDEEKTKVEQEYPNSETPFIDRRNAAEKIIQDKIKTWKDEQHFDYYEFLYRVIESKPEESDLIGQSKEEYQKQLSNLYQTFLSYYDNVVSLSRTGNDEDIESLDAATLLEYNKTGLTLKYPNFDYMTASEIQSRNDIYTAYRKILEKKLKGYQTDLDKLNNLAMVMTSSTLDSSPESGSAREINMNRRYKDLSSYYKVGLGTVYSTDTTYYKLNEDDKTYTPYTYTTDEQWNEDILNELVYTSQFDINKEVQNLLTAIAAAGERYMEGVKTIDGFEDSFRSYYRDELTDYTPEAIVDMLADEFNKSELRQVKRIIDKYDDMEKNEIDVSEYEAERDKLLKERAAKTAGYQAQCANIENEIAQYQEFIDNLEKEIKVLENEIASYESAIETAQAAIKNAQKELNKYEDDEIESNELIEFFANNPDIQNNVKILKEYLEWLKTTVTNVKTGIAASIGGDAANIKDYLAVLIDIITRYSKEAFYFFHKYDALKEDIDELLENDLTNNTFKLESYNNILYLGPSGELPLTERKEYLTSQLLLPEEEELKEHTYKFGIYKYNSNYYLAGIDAKDTDAYYPIPRWLGEDAPPQWFIDEQNAFIAARYDNNSALMPPNCLGSWMEDVKTLTTYRQVIEDTVFDAEKTYYNADYGVYQYIDANTWNLDVENSRVLWKTNMQVKTFSLFDYTMLYDRLAFDPILESNVGSNSIVFIPADKSCPFYPHELATYSHDLLGNAVYDDEESILGSLSNLLILENQYRYALINYIYAFIGQDNFILHNDNYIAYTNAKREYLESMNMLSQWQNQLSALLSVYESGWSENQRPEDQGKKQQLEDLIAAARTQVTIYQDLVNTNKSYLDTNFSEESYTDNLVTAAMQKTNTDYMSLSQELTRKYTIYSNKVEHYLNLLFNTKPFGIIVDKNIAYSIDDQEYNLGLGPAIANYQKYAALQQTGETSIDFSDLINRINQFINNCDTHYELYTLVPNDESYQNKIYSYYYKQGDTYYPYGEYNYTQWIVDTNRQKVYKVNKYLEEFNRVNYLLVPINALYDSNKIYFIKNNADAYEVFSGDESNWNDCKNNQQLYVMSIDNNGGIMQFLNNLLANSDYVRNIVKIYNDSLALYDSLVEQQLGDTTSYQDLIDAKIRYEQQLRDLQEITQYSDDVHIDHAEFYHNIMDALTKYLQALTIMYVEQVEKRYEVG